MEYLIIGVAVAINILVVVWKLQSGRVFNGIIDGALLVLVAITFSNSLGALIIGTIGSLFVSIYLTVKPFKVFA